MDILCHALESYTARLVRRLRRQAARAAGALLRRQPDRRHVVGEGDVAAGRGVPAAVRDGADTRGPRADGAGRDLRRPRASATPACTSRTPTPTRSPAGSATTARRATPRTSRSCRTGWRSSLTAPAAFRFTFDAAPERHLPRGRLLDADADRRRARLLPTCCAALMRDIGLPSGLAELGYGAGRRRRPGRGGAQAAAPARHRTRARSRPRTWPPCSRSPSSTGDLRPRATREE